MNKNINKEIKTFRRELINNFFINEKEIILNNNKIIIKYNKKYPKENLINYIQTRNRINGDNYYVKNKKDYCILYIVDKKYFKHNFDDFKTWNDKNENNFSYGKKEINYKSDSERRLIYLEEIDKYIESIYNKEEDLIINIEIKTEDKSYE